MKKVIISLFLISLSVSVHSQLEIGVLAGLNSTDLASEGIIIVDSDNNSYELNFNDSEYGVHFGLYTRISFAGIYLQPAAIFNSNQVNYRLTELGEEGPFTTLKGESYQYLDIPVLLGFKLGFLRVHGGPVAHLFIDSTSDLFDINGYDQRFKEATYGYQVGMGLDLWKLRLEFQYEGNLTKFGDHINIGNTDYEFADAASRVIGTIGYKF